MRFLRGMLLIVGCIGLGIALGTWEIDGRTPLKHGQHLWKDVGGPAKVERARSTVASSVMGAKEKIVRQTEEIVETHTPSDKDALNKAIARKSGK